jgi:hypothetical protein
LLLHFHQQDQQAMWLMLGLSQDFFLVQKHHHRHQLWWRHPPHHQILVMDLLLENFQVLRVQSAMVIPRAVMVKNLHLHQSLQRNRYLLERLHLATPDPFLHLHHHLRRSKQLV